MDIQRALDDIARFGKQYKGFLDLAENLKEVQTLLNQKGSLEKSVKDLTKQNEDATSVVASSKEELNRIKVEVNSKAKELNALEQGKSKAVKEAQDEADRVSADSVKVLKKAQMDADYIISEANKQAQDMVSKAQSEVALEAEKLSKIRSELNRLKSNLE